MWSLSGSQRAIWSEVNQVRHINICLCVSLVYGWHVPLTRTWTDAILLHNRGSLTRLATVQRCRMIAKSRFLPNSPATSNTAVAPTLPLRPTSIHCNRKQRMILNNLNPHDLFEKLKLSSGNNSLFFSLNYYTTTTRKWNLNFQVKIKVRIPTVIVTTDSLQKRCAIL